MRDIVYLLDENVGPRLYHGLQQHWPEIPVHCVGHEGAPALGTADPDILRWCEAASVSLVTNNRASMPTHLRDHLLAGRHVPGIVIFRRQMALGDAIEELALIWGASSADEYRERLVYLPSPSRL